VPNLETKLKRVTWLAERLAQEGPSLWADREREELAQKLVWEYRISGGHWRVKQAMEIGEEGPRLVFAVTRGELDFIPAQVSVEQADAVARTLNALDSEMRTVASDR
jgi:hypothetical protein